MSDRLRSLHDEIKITLNFLSTCSSAFRLTSWLLTSRKKLFSFWRNNSKKNYVQWQLTDNKIRKFDTYHGSRAYSSIFFLGNVGLFARRPWESLIQLQMRAWILVLIPILRHCWRLEGLYWFACNVYEMVRYSPMSRIPGDTSINMNMNLLTASTNL